MRIGDFSSRGVSAAIPGIKAKRIHHLLSGIETRAFLVAEFNKDVTDIREQFPLLPLNHVEALAKQSDITYPYVNGEPFTLTTDLLLTVNRNNKVSYLAIAVKPSSEVRKKAVLDKLELERLWWNSLGVDWYLCTETDVSQAVEDNLTWVSQDFRAKDFDYESVDLNSLVPLIMNFKPRRYLIRDLIMEIAEALELRSEDAKTILCKAIWEHFLVIDLEVSIPKEGMVNILDWRFDQTAQGDAQNENIA